MSNMAPQFVAAVKAANWKTAYNKCNGQPMYAMLDGLKEIGPLALRDMRAQMAVFDVWGGPNMPRIRFAMDVVETGKLPQTPAGLPPDQVTDARTFLAHTSGQAAAAAKKIRIALFWTDLAKQETLSSGLVQKARELLRSNRTGLDLDVLPVHTSLSFPGEISDSDDAANALALAKQAPSYATDRLCVIFYKITPTQCDPNRQQCARVPYGNTPTDGMGRPYVLINVNKQHPDNATLLHEIGHAAGVQARDSDDVLTDLSDVMSYGSNRTKIGMNQLNLMNRRGLFFTGA
jgi:hypothetical protein